MEEYGRGIARLEEGNYSNYGTAERFLKYKGENYHFCEDTGVWMEFDEKTNLWKEKTESQMIHIIKDIGKAVGADAINFITFEGTPETDDEKKELKRQETAEKAARTYALKLEYKKYCLDSLYFCRGIKKGDICIPCKQDDFDSNPKYIALKDGTVYDLTDRKVMDGGREYMMTKSLNGIVKDRVSEDFTKWITKMFPDEEVRLYMQKYFGSALLGFKLRNPDDKNAMFIDSSMPDTGKSALLTLMENALGDYYRTADYAILVSKKKTDSDKASPSLAALRGCKFVGISECPPGMVFDEAFFKKITGNDTMVTRDVFGRNFEFKPNFKLLLVSNNLPVPINIDDQAFRKRFRRHTCSVSLSHMDDEILKKFYTQDFLDDFITWLVEGCQKYQEAHRLDDYTGKDLMGSNLPVAMKRAMAEYFRENDDIGEFISTWYVITKDKHDFVPLLEMWEVWQSHSYNRSVKQREFNKQVKDFFQKRIKLEFAKRPYVKTDPKTEEVIRTYGRGFIGLRLWTDADLLSKKEA